MLLDQPNSTELNQKLLKISDQTRTQLLTQNPWLDSQSLSGQRKANLNRNNQKKSVDTEPPVISETMEQAKDLEQTNKLIE